MIDRKDYLVQDNFIDALISCKKTITNKQKPKFIEDNRQFRANVNLKAEDTDYKFVMFMRYLSAFREDFSVGLRIEPTNPWFSNPTILLRFQGPHGGQSLTRTGSDIHNDYHIHIYTLEDYNSGRYKASYKSPSKDFSSMEEAIVAFLDFCNIKDPYDIFRSEKESVNQLRLDLSELELQ